MITENRGLNELAKIFHRFQIKAGFTDSNISQRLMLVVSEISESFEAYRKDRFCVGNFIPTEMAPDQESFKFVFERDIKDTVEDEIADAIIRLLAFCGENNIDIERHIDLKHRYNLSRGFKYGGKKF